MSYIDLYSVLENLQISAEQFLGPRALCSLSCLIISSEISLLAGVSELIPSFSIVNEKAEFTSSLYWRIAYEMVKAGRSAWSLIEEHSSNPSVRSIFIYSLSFCESEVIWAV